jgi:S-DNA-T family DNA segregation ATPase FtsK/SpoIIIE
MATTLRARGDDRALYSTAVRGLVRRRMAELVGVALALAGAALLLALASYRATDPSLDTAASGAARNLLGLPGAVLADLLLQWFGLAGVLPALALLAWAWRIGSRHGLGSLVLRGASLTLALPVLAASLSAWLALAPGGHGAAVSWPAGAGPGGALGRLIAGVGIAAGRDMIGTAGGAAMAALDSALAVVLTVLALGLSRREWRTVAGFAGGVARGGGRAASAGSRFGAGVAAAGARALDRLNGVRREPPPNIIQPEGLTPDAPVRAPGQMRYPETPAPDAVPPALARAAARADGDTAAPWREAMPARPAPRVAARKPPLPQPRQETLSLDAGVWRFPPLSLLYTAPPRAQIGAPSPESLEANARLLEGVLADYGVQGRIVEIRPGPVVTLYELEPAPGIRSARVIGLGDDVARSLSVMAVRIATVPGRNVIGIEVPNAKRETVYLSELLSGPDFDRQAPGQPGRLTLALGKEISGDTVTADLARMPHLLVAGTTGSGKSVGINAMILSLLFRLSPDQCRLIMIDPKMLELSVYEGIPHLMAPVVTEPKKAVVALKWTVREMERRYRAMSQLSVRNIGGYNERVAEARARGEVVTRRVQTGFDSETGKPVFEDQPLALERLPYIVVVIDEMADLMMVAGKEIEAAVQRLAQMARAAGIHVVMATQRPSVDVITGTIKANFPTRISFQVISKFDSRTILGEQGAEQLLGQGDMLYMAGGGRITRVHGPFVSEREVESVVAFLREQGEPAYVEEVTESPEENAGEAVSGIAGASDAEKSLFDQAVDVVSREGKASTSFIQRHLQIGYNRAARLIEQMEKEGIVGPANHVGKREVLVRRADED